MSYAILEKEKGTDITIDIICEYDNYSKTVNEYLKARLKDYLRINSLDELLEFNVFQEYQQYQTLKDILDTEEVNYDEYKKEFQRIINNYDKHKDIVLIEI